MSEKLCRDWAAVQLLVGSNKLNFQEQTNIKIRVRQQKKTTTESWMKALNIVHIV